MKVSMAIIDFASGLFMVVVIILLVLLTFGLIRSFQRRFPISAKYNKVLWKASSIFVLLTPFIIPIRVADESQFERLTFGLPFGFVEQYVHHVVADRAFPFITTLINPWGASVMGNLNIRVDLFVMSAVSVYVTMYLLFILAKKLRIIKDNA